MSTKAQHLCSLLAGLEIGQTFRFVAQPHIDGGRLVAVLKDWTQPKHTLHIMYPPNWHLNAKPRLFGDWVTLLFAAVSSR
jgi:DNA-binding transcriptional LysR family regulator